AAMSSPWIFQQTKQYLATNKIVDSPGARERWDLILRHCQLAVEQWGAEEPAIRSMRAHLMAYSKGFPGSKVLREKFQHVSTLAEIERIAEEHLTRSGSFSGSCRTDSGALESAVPCNVDLQAAAG